MDNQTITTPQRQRLHPLVAIAAGAVIIASLAATAAVTGLLPKASGTTAPDAAAPATQPVTSATSLANTAPGTPSQAIAAPQATAQSQAVSAQQVAQQQPAAAPRPVTHHRRAVPPAPQYSQQAQAPYPQPAYCQSCGTVVAINTIRTPGQSSGLGALGGAAAGGLLGNQFGHGGGRAAMTVLGVLGGGLAGNSVEQQVNAETDYQVQVQMESGATRTFTYRNAPPFGQGQRVRIENGMLVGV